MDYKMKNKELDVYDLSVEISGVAEVISGLAMQFAGDYDRMTDNAMLTSMIGISRYLERIADDVGALEVVGKE